MQEKHTKLEEKIRAKTDVLSAIRNEMAKVIVGQERLIDGLLVSIFAGGHALLEGVPGLAKTTAIATLAGILDMEFKRIQFTPDLLPSDLIGSRVFNQKNSSFYVKKGPIFANFILADEINRSPAKVQSALLEAMQERQVTIGEESFALPEPFFVMATQNPIEQEGTYQLPEAQVDRFLLKINIDYPSKEEELKIIQKAEVEGAKLRKVADARAILELIALAKEIFIDESLKKYIVDIVQKTREPGDIEIISGKINNLIAYGASPRASLGLMSAAKAVAMMAGRAFVIPDDIKKIAYEVLGHRVIVSYEAEAENINSKEIISAILKNVKVP